MIDQKRAQMPDYYSRLQIAVEAGVHPRTVLKCYRAQPVRSSVAARVRAACAKLSLPEPVIVIAQ